MEAGARIILVAGLLEHDSGKTWSTVALVKAMRKLGLRVYPFKPVAGLNIWYSYRAFRESIERGLLVSNDLLFYKYSLGLGDDVLALVNPYVLMLSFPDPERVGGVAKYLASVASVERSLVLARETVCGGGSFESRHYVFIDSLRWLPSTVRRAVEELAEKLKAQAVSDVEKFMHGVGGDSFECLRQLVESVGGVDVVVMESFNNAVQPFEGAALKADLFVVVAPGRLTVFEGDRLRRALEVVGRAFAATVDKVYPLLKPLVSVELPLAGSVDELASFIYESGIPEILTPLLRR